MIFTDLFVVVCNVKRRIHLDAYVMLRGFFKIILMSAGEVTFSYR